jgi:hypothetical protein
LEIKRLSKKLIVPMIVVLALLSVIPYAYAQTLPSTVTIIGICGATPAPPAVNYGILPPNAISTEQTVNLLNTGNAPSAVSVSGNAWIGAANTVMNVGATHYGTSSSSYATKTPLSTTAVSLTTIPATQNRDTFWQLQTALSDPAYNGPAAQTVTLTVTCQ